MMAENKNKEIRMTPRNSYARCLLAATVSGLLLSAGAFAAPVNEYQANLKLTPFWGYPVSGTVKETDASAGLVKTATTNMLNLIPALEIQLMSQVNNSLKKPLAESIYNTNVFGTVYKTGYRAMAALVSISESGPLRLSMSSIRNSPNMRMVIGSVGSSENTDINIQLAPKVEAWLANTALTPVQCTVDALIRNPNVQTNYNPVTGGIDKTATVVALNTQVKNVSCDWLGLSALDRALPGVNLGTRINGFITSMVYSYVQPTVQEQLKNLPSMVLQQIPSKSTSLPSILNSVIPNDGVMGGFPVGNWLATMTSQVLTTNNNLTATIRAEDGPLVACTSGGGQKRASKALDASWSNPLLTLNIGLVKTARSSAQCQ